MAACVHALARESRECLHGGNLTQHSLCARKAHISSCHSNVVVTLPLMCIPSSVVAPGLGRALH